MDDQSPVRPPGEGELCARHLGWPWGPEATPGRARSPSSRGRRRDARSDRGARRRPRGARRRSRPGSRAWANSSPSSRKAWPSTKTAASRRPPAAPPWRPASQPRTFRRRGARRAAPRRRDRARGPRARRRRRPARARARSRTRSAGCPRRRPPAKRPRRRASRGQPCSSYTSSSRSDARALAERQDSCEQRAHAGGVERGDRGGGRAARRGLADEVARDRRREERDERLGARPAGRHRVAEAGALEQRGGGEDAASRSSPRGARRAGPRAGVAGDPGARAGWRTTSWMVVPGPKRMPCSASTARSARWPMRLRTTASTTRARLRRAGRLARLRRRAAPGRRLAAQGALEGGSDQAVLVAEVLVEGADRDAGRPRDAIGRGARVAVGAQHLLGRVEEDCPRSLRPRLARPLSVVLRCFESQDPASVRGRRRAAPTWVTTAAARVADAGRRQKRRQNSWAVPQASLSKGGGLAHAAHGDRRLALEAGVDRAVVVVVLALPLRPRRRRSTGPRPAAGSRSCRSRPARARRPRRPGAARRAVAVRVDQGLAGLPARTDRHARVEGPVAVGVAALDADAAVGVQEQARVGALRAVADRLLDRRAAAARRRA